MLQKRLPLLWFQTDVVGLDRPLEGAAPRFVVAGRSEEVETPRPPSQGRQRGQVDAVFRILLAVRPENLKSVILSAQKHGFGSIH
jgi:hypothetical protein